MSRKMYVSLHIMVTINADYDVDLAEIIDGMEFGITSGVDSADVEDVIISDYELVDSR